MKRFQMYTIWINIQGAFVITIYGNEVYKRLKFHLSFSFMAVNVVSRGEECLPLFDRFIFGGGEQQDNLSAVAFQREKIQLLLSRTFDSLLFASNNDLHYEIESFLQRLNDKFSLYLNARMIWQKSPSFHTAWSHTMPDNIGKMERFSFQFI